MASTNNNKWMSDDNTKVEFDLSSSGVTIFCANLTLPRFVPFDQKGRCPTCKSDNVEIDYTIHPEGLTIYCSRMKKEKFVAFDIPMTATEDNALVRIRARSKPYNIPIKASKYYASNDVLVDKPLPTKTKKKKLVEKQDEVTQTNKLPIIDTLLPVLEPDFLEKILAESMDNI